MATTKRASKPSTTHHHYDAPAIHVGADKHAIAEVRESILAILNAHADQETIRAALTVLQGAAAVSGLSINNARIHMGPPTAMPSGEDE